MQPFSIPILISSAEIYLNFFTNVSSSNNLHFLQMSTEWWGFCEYSLATAIAILVGRVKNNPTMQFFTENFSLLALSLFSLLRNLHMSLLIGFRVEKDYKYNESEVLRYIAFLESKFSLIMIADHFHESVILLRRLMNWSIKGQYPSAY